MLRTHLSEQALANSALCVAMLLWGSSFIALKIAVSAFDPMVMVFGRMATSLVALIVLWVLMRRKAEPVRLQPGDIKFLVLLALCEPCLYFVFEGYAMHYTTASQAGMISGVLPLGVVAAAWIFLGERLLLRVWVGFVLAVAGVFWLSDGAIATENATNPVLGNSLEACAMLCGALYIVCAKRLSAACSPLFITLVQSLLGSLFFLPTLALPIVKLPEHFPLWPTLAVVYLGVGVTLISFLCYNYAIKRVSAARTGAFINLVPVIALLMGIVFLDERLTLGQGCACVLVLGGVVVSQWKASPVAPTSPTSGSLS
ncbi:MAG: DMT family transporter [Bilophila sp.]